jgi:hypothetical protein
MANKHLAEAYSEMFPELAKAAEEGFTAGRAGEPKAKAITLPSMPCYYVWVGAWLAGCSLMDDCR